jgi:trimeric autotransporter adhesin
MKKSFLFSILLLVALFCSQTIWAQAPDKMSYQAVIRDASGALIKSAPVGIKFSLLQSSVSGTAVYVETQTVTTNSNGVATAAIGGGTVVSGTMATIDWSTGPYFIKTETDPTGGSSYSISSTTQLLSVPYALYAKTSGSALSDTVINTWRLKGNAGTNRDSKFIGTTDSNDLVFKRNNVFAGHIGSTNTSFGQNSLKPSSTGLGGNTAFGYRALSSISSTTLGNYNTAMGYMVLDSATSGVYNVAIGINCLERSSTGSTNIAIGESVLRQHTSGDDNIGIGEGVLMSNTTGGYNIGMGYASFKFSDGGTNNVGIGTSTLMYNTGSSNVAIGSYALNGNTSGNSNTAIGASAGMTISFNNTICVGSGSGGSAMASNRAEIGNTSMTWIGGQVAWSTYSDKRIKKDIQENVPGLDFIKRLRPVTYHIDAHKQYQMLAAKGKVDTAQWAEKYDIEKITQTGFIAQEVADAAKVSGYDFSGVDVPKSEADLYSVRYSDFVMPLVKAVQEQQALIEKLEKRIAELEKK